MKGLERILSQIRPKEGEARLESVQVSAKGMEALRFVSSAQLTSPDKVIEQAMACWYRAHIGGDSESLPITVQPKRRKNKSIPLELPPRDVQQHEVISFPLPHTSSRRVAHQKSFLEAISKPN